MESVILTDPYSKVALRGAVRTSGHSVVRIGESVRECEIEIVVEDEASWDVTVIAAAVPSFERPQDDTTHLKITQRHTIGTGARLTVHIITLHPQVDHQLVSHVTGADSESGIDWMFYGKGTDRQTLNVQNIFDGRAGRGEILMRGIAEDKAQSVCKGMIEIGLKGGGTNTYLTQEVLMLDPTAKVDAVPGLEIKTNDVKASHSATVTRLTPEDLFYFASRGIPKKEARAMYVLGFLGAITERIGDESVREEIVRMIGEKYESEQ